MCLGVLAAEEEADAEGVDDAMAATESTRVKGTEDCPVAAVAAADA